MKDDVYVLAHEVKNPLCVAKGYLQMMNKNNYIRYMEIIKKEIDMSIDILDNYLELKKINLDKEEFDLNLLLLDLKESMHDYLKKHGVHLLMKLIDDDIYLEADYSKIKQVFYNIIKNSVESSSKEIKIYYEIKYDELIVIVTNDGDKIQSDVFNKIGNNYSNKVLGNGIGMTLSKKIIEMHNGTIEYQNNKNRGINIKIMLPM